MLFKEYDALKKLSKNKTYRKAIEKIFQRSNSIVFDVLRTLDDNFEDFYKEIE